MKTSTISRLLVGIALVSSVTACTDAQINQVAQILSKAQQQSANGRQAVNPNQQQPQSPTAGQGQFGKQPTGQRQPAGADQGFGQAPTGQTGQPQGDGMMQPPPPPPLRVGDAGGPNPPMTGDQQQAAVPPAPQGTF